MAMRSDTRDSQGAGVSALYAIVHRITKPGYSGTKGASKRGHMHKLLTIAAMLVLGGCAAPQEQVLKQMPSVSPQTRDPVNCTTVSERLTSHTTCQ
jgi:hypothetical protein